MYVSVRGWIEVAPAQRAAVEKIIADAEDGFYSGGWGFPRAPFNWSLSVFHGGDVREEALDWLRGQLMQIAALDPVDEDGDLPVGLLILTDERGSVTAWEIDAGVLRARPALRCHGFSRPERFAAPRRGVGRACATATTASVEPIRGSLASRSCPE